MHPETELPRCFLMVTKVTKIKNSLKRWRIRRNCKPTLRLDEQCKEVPAGWGYFTFAQIKQMMAMIESQSYKPEFHFAFNGENFIVRLDDPLKRDIDKPKKDDSRMSF